MKKRWTAALLALALAAALLPAPARAAQADQADRSAGARFTGAERAIYDTLRAEVAKIADGSRSSTSIRIPDQSALSWTLEELGLAGGRGENVLKSLEGKFDEAIRMEAIILALKADSPFDMYWEDNSYSWSYASVREDGRVRLVDLTICIQPAQAYRAGDSSVSASKVSAAKKAAEAAKAIVAKYQDCSDYEKLNAYREEICALTSYNMEALDSTVPYGDPWQAVYVFDGDPATEVVCEGYAKAFKYLCDLSDFEQDITCYIVSGLMDGGSHMWNVVRMGDGRNYLVDVTNCDAGMVGEDDKLFLSGGSTGRDGMICSISKEHCRAVYVYGAEQEDLLTDGYLVISEEDYVDRPPATITVAPPQYTQPVESTQPAEPSGPDDASGTSAPAFTDVAAGAYYEESVIWAVAEKITAGTTTTTFSPGQPCTHAQILTFLWRAEGEPESSGAAPEGVTADDFFYDALRWADEKGMLSEDFEPRAGCSRADAVWYIWSAFDQPPAEASSFTDVAGDADYARAVDWALAHEVTTGATTTTFGPDTICSRGQIVTFLYRAYH